MRNMINRRNKFITSSFICYWNCEETFDLVLHLIIIKLKALFLKPDLMQLPTGQDVLNSYATKPCVKVWLARSPREKFYFSVGNK